MIIAQDTIRNYIKSQRSMDELSSKTGIATSTLYGVTKGNNVSSETVAKLLQETGFEFEKAFEITE